MNKKTMASMILGLLMVLSVGMVKGVECPPPGDPTNPNGNEGQVKASPSPTPSATPAAGVVR